MSQADRITTILIFFLIFSLQGFAGNESQPTGARKIALGNAYTGVGSDFWALYSNPAGLAGLDQMQAGVHFERRFLLSQLNYGAFGFAAPFKKKHIVAVDGSGYGFASYSEMRAGLTYATTVLERVNLGAKLNYTQTSILQYGSAGTFYLDLGVNTSLTENLNVGFHVFNANRAYIKKEIQEQVPTILSLGVAYNVSDKVLWVADVEKHINYQVAFKTGIEYKFHEKFCARAGMNTYPVSFHAGAGINLKNLQVDIANSYYLDGVGYSPQLSLSYRFGSGSKTGSSNQSSGE